MKPYYVLTSLSLAGMILQLVMVPNLENALTTSSSVTVSLRSLVKILVSFDDTSYDLLKFLVLSLFF